MNKFTLLILVFFLAACDTKKDEQNALRLELDNVQQTIASVDQKIQALEAAQRNSESTLASLKEYLAKDEANIKENKKSLADYVLAHKSAVAAVAATSAGVASVLAENLDDQERGTALAAGLIGAGYCLFMADDGECSDATAKVGYYGAQIVLYRNEAKRHNEQIDEYRSKLAGIQNQRAPFLAERTTLSTKIETLASQIESLRCRYCL